jgi:DNA polymerase
LAELVQSAGRRVAAAEEKGEVVEIAVRDRTEERMPAGRLLNPLRIVRQQLESWNAAGVTHISALSVPPIAPTVAQVPPAASAPPPFEARFRIPTQAAEMPMRSVQSKPSPALFADPPVSSPESRPLPPTQAPLSLDARIERLKLLADVVRGCTLCRELAATRRQTVFGVGDPQARILFIGEAPGADEDEQGEPFVGKAGQLLNQIIVACRLQREQVYICNILKCRPPGNRTPLPDECANCRTYLDGQLATIDPEYIVCWGAVAAQNLLGTDVSIGKLRRRFFRHGRAKVLCTYHPSYLLRNPAAKKDVWEDMQFLFADMRVDLTQKT